MSMRSKRSGRPGMYMSSGSFSSKSMGSYSIPKISTPTNYAAPITSVTFNKSLLTPLNIDIDPTVQAVRTKEKDQIKSLNNRFVSFIDKVRHLEQQNKMLDTKWKMLQQQTAATSNTEPMLRSYIANLQKQLDLLTNDKQRLDMENGVMHRHVDDYKTKYEEEINKRNDAENEFVVLKKDVDAGYLSKVDLNDRLSSLSDEFNFLMALYDTEMRELKESLKETSVVVQMDNSRDLNMDRIVSDVKAQYEDIAARSREEASISFQRASLDKNIVEVEERGERAVLDAKTRIRELEQALKRAKQDMARQLREYQELMNVKLALDIEISTYRKM